MKAIVVQEFGGPMQVTNVPEPHEGIVVRTAWAGVNYVDTYQRAGLYPGVQLPLAMGIEGAGVIHAVPPESPWRVGQRVVYSTGVQGTYAEFVSVPSEHLIEVPEALSLHDACASIEHGMTAYMLMEWVARLHHGDTVLVHAASGGVGGWLVQWLVARGFRVFGTVSSESKAAWLASIGVTPLRYDQGFDWQSELQIRNGGRPVEVVFDSVGQATFDGSLEVLAPGGHLVLFGAASGQPQPVEITRLMKKSLTLSRPVLGHYARSWERLQTAANAVFAALLSGDVTLRVHARFALEQAEAAHALLESRATQGKLLLAVASEIDGAFAGERA